MKKILFVTGTRADFGKLKSLIQAVKDSPEYEYELFVTGMHLLSQYGLTIREIEKSGFTNKFSFMNQVVGDDMEIILSNTINGLSTYLHEHPVDLIIVHGDRVETLAGAIVGSLRNILVAHIEGGEISGTIDELIRHAVSKLSHVHFVATEVAQKRLLQLGEEPESIFVIGSPDVDIMLSDTLPTIEMVKERYRIKFDTYAIGMLHPVTTDTPDIQQKHADIFVETLLESGFNYVIIYPNNDSGSEIILQAYEKLQNNARFRIFSSIRFEYFLTLLKMAHFIIGNSSAGIHEAPVYGIPSFNLGSRQQNRFHYDSIFNVPFDKALILEHIHTCSVHSYMPTQHYGQGTSALNFLNALHTIWQFPKQKQFNDIVYEENCCPV
ncbi:MAG: UDP-N-acetylglucosamine 2-epimerase [Treponema sp.]|jgi:UDP-N-acetylglucosamine 2-epimerase (hydrolysing)|nr:UDP-N-acetylglucosamine 2-epimerase [Treponema sp.]